MAEASASLLETCSAQQLDAFGRYYELLVEWNEKMNLTSIVDRDEVYVKHFYDSLVIQNLPEWMACAERSGRAVDVGTGAGFPGLPLAICFPDVEVVLMDSLNKRIGFLREVVAQLGLKNVSCVHARAEDGARDARWRNQFDAVLSRAVARLNVLVELTTPFARVGGVVLAYKGPSVDQELADGKRAAAVVGASVKRVESFVLPEGRGERSVVVIEQQKPTPKAYPRKSGTPQKQPL